MSKPSLKPWLASPKQGTFYPTATRSGEGHGIPLQYSCLENPTDRGAWWATVQGVATGRTRPKRLSTHVWMSESRKNDSFFQGSQNPGNKQSDNAKVKGSAGFIAQPKLGSQGRLPGGGDSWAKV